MNKIFCASVAAALLLTACGQGGTGGGEPPRGDNSRERSVAFKIIGGDMKEIGDVIKGNTAYDVEKFKAKTAELLAHSQVPFLHLQRDGNGMDGFAKPEVWSDAAGFKTEQDKFLQAVNALNEAAQTGNLEQIKAAFGPVGGSCKSCHDGFKISAK